MLNSGPSGIRPLGSSCDLRLSCLGELAQSRFYNLPLITKGFLYAPNSYSGSIITIGS